MITLYKYSTMDCKHIKCETYKCEFTIESIYLTNGERVYLSDINKLFITNTGEKYLYSWEKNDGKFCRILLKHLNVQISKLQHMLDDYSSQFNGIRTMLKENFDKKINSEVSENK